MTTTFSEPPRDFGASDEAASYASFAKAAGLGQMDIALLMNHKLAGVMGGYIQETTLIEHLKAAQERGTRHILSFVDA